MGWNVRHVSSLDISALGQIVSKRSVDQEVLGILGT